VNKDDQNFYVSVDMAGECTEGGMSRGKMSRSHLSNRPTVGLVGIQTKVAREGAIG